MPTKPSQPPIVKNSFPSQPKAKAKPTPLGSITEQYQRQKVRQTIKPDSWGVDPGLVQAYLHTTPTPQFQYNPPPAPHQNTGDTGYFGNPQGQGGSYFGNPQGQGGSYFGNPGGSNQSAPGHFPNQVLSVPNALSQQSAFTGAQGGVVKSTKPAPNWSSDPNTNPFAGYPSSAQSFQGSAPAGASPQYPNLQTTPGYQASIPGQPPVGAHPSVPYQSNPLQQQVNAPYPGAGPSLTSQMPYGSINAIEHAQGTMPEYYGAPPPLPGTGTGGAGGVGGGGTGFSGIEPDRGMPFGLTLEQKQQWVREHGGQMGTGTGGVGGGSGSGGGATGPIAGAIPGAAPNLPAEAPDWVKMITNAIKQNPGGTLKIPPEWQANLSKFGLYDNLIGILRALGLQGIGVQGPYNGETDFTIPMNLQGVDLQGLMAGMDPRDQFILNSLLERWFGPMAAPQATPAPTPPTPPPATT